MNKTYSNAIAEARLVFSNCIPCVPKYRTVFVYDKSCIESIADSCISNTFSDIALGKTAVQSSTKHNGFASRAVDGNYKFHWSDKSCTHTDNERDPWWRVDLGKEYIVTGN